MRKIRGSLINVVALALGLFLVATIIWYQRGTNEVIARAGRGKQSKSVESPPATSEATNAIRPVQNQGQEPAAKEPLTKEKAIAELLKYNGHAVADQDDPEKPIVRVWFKSYLSTDDGLAYLKEFPKLKYVQILYTNKFTDAGMEHLSGLTNLERLDIGGPTISDAGLVHLKDLSNLETLSLSFNDITDAGLVHLKGLTKLKSLALDDTPVTRTGIEKLQQALPNCRILTSFDKASPIDTSQASSRIKGSEEPANNEILTSSSAGDWPQWRGPSRDGRCLEIGLLQEWPEEGPPLCWEVNGVGEGHSSVTIENGRMFTMGGLNQDSYLFALDPKTGEELWQTKIGPQNSNLTFATPTVDGDYVYALDHEGHLICARVTDGEEVWRRSFIEDFGGDYMSRGFGGGYSESVLIDGDRLICTPGAKDAMMAGLDKKTGETIWTAAYPPDVGPQGVDVAGFCSPIISHACGIKQYVQLSGRGLMSVAADDGRTLWAYNRIAVKHATISTPIIVGDYVFASTARPKPEAGTALLKLLPDNGGIKVEEVYRLDKRFVSNHHGGMVRIGDYIYMGHGYNRGFPLCLEMKTGKIAWRPGRGPGSGSAAVLYADGHLYFRYENGVMALIEATPEAYVLKGKFNIESSDREWSHPVISRGCLFVRSQNKLQCYDLKPSF